MDISFILERRLAVGGGIWTPEEMAEVAGLGFTHVINLQSEFDHSEMARAAGLKVLWNPTLDDLQAKPAAFFDRTVSFALAALEDKGAQVYVHCAAGVHRGPLATASILCGLGYAPEIAVQMVQAGRDWADFPEVYVASLLRWAHSRQRAPIRGARRRGKASI